MINRFIKLNFEENPMRALLIALMAAAVMPTSTRAAEPRVPRTFQYDGRDLVATTDRLKAGDQQIARAVKSLTKEADKALAVGTFSVVNKSFTPPSGDKHDYASLSPYWWADPSKADGKPYIRKDGQTNPERLQYDQPALDAFTDSA